MIRVSNINATAAIPKLVAGEMSADAFAAVIRFGNTLPHILSISSLLSSRYEGSDDGLSQLWSLPNGCEECERNKRRLGGYIIWKEEEGLLIFHALSEEDKETEKYHLKYDRKTFKIKYFGVERRKYFLDLGLLLFYWRKLNLIVGRKWVKVIGLGVSPA